MTYHSTVMFHWPHRSTMVQLGEKELGYQEVGNTEAIEGAGYHVYFISIY
jgi:hypothetical protein